MEGNTPRAALIFPRSSFPALCEYDHEHFVLKVRICHENVNGFMILKAALLSSPAESIWETVVKNMISQLTLKTNSQEPEHFTVSTCLEGGDSFGMTPWHIPSPPQQQSQSSPKPGRGWILIPCNMSMVFWELFYWCVCSGGIIKSAGSKC